MNRSQPQYWAEELTDDERARLAPYVTNLDRPVFALRNLPEATKGALFARYSRSGKTLRRLFLDEFADQVEAGEHSAVGEVGVARATALYQRVFNDYGDDSVAQLGGAHVACEQASNLLTKLLEWGRLAAYLEQSTRYVSYADRPGGRWRYHLDPDVDASDLGPEYRQVLDGLFATYAELLPALTDHLAAVVPQEPGSSEAAWRRAVKARALDGLRGLLPAATTSNLGIFATGQAYEALLLRLRASVLPEARSYADLLLEELRQVIPAFLHRVDREDRGVAWSRYLAETASETAKVVEAVLGEAPPAVQPGPSVRLTEFDPAGQDKVLTPPWTSVRPRSPPGWPGSGTRTGPGCWPPTWASGATAATGPAGPSSGPSTPSTWSPTTAPSGTSSGTGCARSCGSRSPPGSATTCPATWPRPGWPDASRPPWPPRPGCTRPWPPGSRPRRRTPWPWPTGSGSP
jgi:thymidylate synthase ThyX